MQLVEKLTPFKIITEAEAENHFHLLNYMQQGFGDTCKYILLEGDAVISGDIDTCQLCTETGTYGIIVAGNLSVTGVLFQPDADYGEALFVTGNLRAKSINKGGAEFYIRGNLVVEQTIYGHRNYGSLIVEGNTQAVSIFSEDQYFRFEGAVQGFIIGTGHRVDGVIADFETTEPLLDELINNVQFSFSGTMNQYIADGKHIIKEKYLALKETLKRPAQLSLEEALAVKKADQKFQQFIADEQEKVINQFENPEHPLVIKYAAMLNLVKQRMVRIKYRIFNYRSAYRTDNPEPFKNAFVLNKCSAHQLEQFEIKHALHLPDELKAYLMEIGEGGAGYFRFEGVHLYKLAGELQIEDLTIQERCLYLGRTRNQDQLYIISNGVYEGEVWVHTQEEAGTRDCFEVATPQRLTLLAFIAESLWSNIQRTIDDLDQAWM